eukprot:1137157-Pelagomonas_calceolata.AAC.4
MQQVPTECRMYPPVVMTCVLSRPLTVQAAFALLTVHGGCKLLELCVIFYPLSFCFGDCARGLQAPGAEPRAPRAMCDLLVERVEEVESEVLQLVGGAGGVTPPGGVRRRGGRLTRPITKPILLKRTVPVCEG